MRQALFFILGVGILVLRVMVLRFEGLIYANRTDVPTLGRIIPFLALEYGIRIREITLCQRMHIAGNFLATARI